MMQVVGFLLFTRLCVASGFLQGVLLEKVALKNFRSQAGVAVASVNPSLLSRLFSAKCDKEDTSRTATDGGELSHAFIARQTRPDFDILQSRTIGNDEKPLIYLDSGATSQKPKPVLDTLQHYYNVQNSNVHRGAHTLSREATAAYEEARQKVASFVGAKRDEIVFTSGATDALNLVAQTYGRTLQEGDEIVLTVAEHHANLVPWQMLANERGVVLRFVTLNDDGTLDLDQMKSLLTEKTKLVAFQHVSNVLSTINPVREIGEMVRASCPDDCKIVLDACQSVPHMPVDVRALGVDFLVASGHKMCGPTGIGFLWGNCLNDLPPWKGGGEMIDQVTLTASTWQPAPGRFEAGTPAIAQAIGLGAAVDYLTGIGMENIEAYEHELAEYLYTRLSMVPGITIFGPAKNRSGLCAFAHDTVHASDLSTFLDIEGIAVRAGHHCCQPLHTELGISHSSRASCYFYNTAEEIDYFIDKLETTLNFFDTMESSSDDDGEEAFVPFI